MNMKHSTFKNRKTSKVVKLFLSAKVNFFVSMESFLETGTSAHALMTCPAQGTCAKTVPFSFNFKDLTSIFLFLSSHVGVDGFISNISLGSTYAWYMRIGQFELVFLGIIMLQILILRYLEILPINMNNLFLGDPSGRKRRRTRSILSPKVCQRDELAESMLQVLKKLDDGECLPFVLCNLQTLSQTEAKDLLAQNLDFELPQETEKLLNALNASGKHRKKHLEECNPSPNMVYFEDAVNLGDSTKHLNSTICQERYHACPLTIEDIVQYVGIIGGADML